MSQLVFRYFPTILNRVADESEECEREKRTKTKKKGRRGGEEIAEEVRDGKRKKTYSWLVDQKWTVPSVEVVAKISGSFGLNTRFLGFLECATTLVVVCNFNVTLLFEFSIKEEPTREEALKRVGPELEEEEGEPKPKVPEEEEEEKEEEEEVGGFCFGGLFWREDFGEGFVVVVLC
jgi:hypothetical protein